MQMTSKLYQDFWLLTKQSFLPKTTRNLNNFTKIINFRSLKLNLDLMSISVFGTYRDQNELGSVDWDFGLSGEKSKICAYINWKLERSEAWTAITQPKSQKRVPVVILNRVQSVWKPSFYFDGTCFKNMSEERLAKCRILDESLILDEK